MKTVQELADSRLKPEYRQPVKTLEAALVSIGWENVDHPSCCGQPVELRGWFGSCYSALCTKCRKFIYDVTGPEFSNGGGCVWIPDNSLYDLDTPERWVCGQEKEITNGSVDTDSGSLRAGNNHN